jgi:hypothetical protein
VGLIFHGSVLFFAARLFFWNREISQKVWECVSLKPAVTLRKKKGSIQRKIRKFMRKTKGKFIISEGVRQKRGKPPSFFTR